MRNLRSSHDTKRGKRCSCQGDTIDIGAGSYTENVTIAGKQLTLSGAVGGTNGTTKVFAAGRGPVFTLGSGVAGDVNGQHSITRTTISHNSVDAGLGGGIFATGASGTSWTLSSSFVIQNLAGAGVVTLGAGDLVLTNTVVTGNLGGDLCIGGIC